MMTDNCSVQNTMLWLPDEDTRNFTQSPERFTPDISLSSYNPVVISQGDSGSITEDNFTATNLNSVESVSNDGVTHTAEDHISTTDLQNTSDQQVTPGVYPPPDTDQYTSGREVEVETTQLTTFPRVNYQNNRDSSEETNMSEENVRLEEKLRQFQNDVKKVRTYDTMGQHSSSEAVNSVGNVSFSESEGTNMASEIFDHFLDCDESDDTKGTYNTTQISDTEKQRRRNLIFDEERFEETFLKCLICREMYNEFDKLPKMLHCHHTFCLDCLFQMYRVESEFRQSLTGVFRATPMTVKILCPTCRESILISDVELRRLPNDHTIMELLCFVSQTSKNEVQYCTKHQMQPLNFFCEPCILPVCCDCTVIDHKESKGHVVVNVDEAMKKYAPIVNETLEDIVSEKAVLAQKREALEGSQDDIDNIQMDLTNQIKKVFDGIRAVLDERERELYDIADAEIERKREILDGHLRVLIERESELNVQFTDLQRAKEDKDISLIFTGQKSAQDVLGRKVNIPLNTTKGFAVTFHFSSRAETNIKQQIVNLGDIVFHS